MTYKTAWLLLQKLRRCMVNPERTPLFGVVEVDETSIGLRTKSDPVTGGQGKSPVGKRFIIGAIEKRGPRKSGRLRLAWLPEDNAKHIVPFVLANTAPGATLRRDANPSYDQIKDRKHDVVNLSARNQAAAHIALPLIHRAFSNLKRWAMGTFHGFRPKHLDAYLSKFVFHWNRRRSFQSNMDAILGMSVRRGPTSYRDIVGDTTEWCEEHSKHIDRLTDWAVGRAKERIPVAVTRQCLPSSRRKPSRPVLPPKPARRLQAPTILYRDTLHPDWLGRRPRNGAIA